MCINTDRKMEFCSEILRSAIKYERQGSWRKVIRKYRELISRLLAESLKQRVEESKFRMLLYECHYHCATAYCHLQQTSLAIKHYESAIKVINQKKINCCVGCVAGKSFHLHVPALGKIAICYLQQGEYKMALKRTEEALQLDVENSDLFCIKASTWFLLKEMTKAMKDINFAIWLNPKHVCAWLLRGLFKEIKRHKSCQITNRDFEMASTLDSTALAYTSNINISKVHHILGRYLPTLRVSHTTYPENVISCVDDDIQRNSKKVVHERTPCVTLSLRKQCSSTELTPDTIPRVKTVDTKRKEEPFVCGTSTSFHRPQTLSRTKQKPFIDYSADNLRTKSAPDVRTRRIDHFSPFGPPLRQLELDRRIKQSIRSTDTLQRSQLPHKNTIPLHRPTTIAFLPSKQKSSRPEKSPIHWPTTITFLPSKHRFESSRPEKSPKTRSKTTCYSEVKVTIGDILSARVRTSL